MSPWAGQWKDDLPFDAETFTTVLDSKFYPKVKVFLSSLVSYTVAQL
jgi:hypothetical protein